LQKAERGCPGKKRNGKIRVEVPSVTSQKGKKDIVTKIKGDSVRQILLWDNLLFAELVTQMIKSEAPYQGRKRKTLT